MDLNVYLAYQRARTRTVAARAEAKLARLGGGGETKTPSDDAVFARKIIAIWKRGGRGLSRGKSTINCPSGHKIVYNHVTGEVEK